MNLFTHLNTSIKLKHVIEKNFNIRLSTARFMFGSIKPDVSPKYIKIEHYFKDSDGFVREEIKSILETKIYESKKCSGNFSERLGILTHYLADFFCYVHSEYFTGSMPEHYVYEMQQFFSHTSNSKEITHFCNNVDIAINHNASSIWNYIGSLHEEYLSECSKADFSIDMSYTLKACLSMCFSIISACIVSEEIHTPQLNIQALTE